MEGGGEAGEEGRTRSSQVCKEISTLSSSSSFEDSDGPDTFGALAKKKVNRRASQQMTGRTAERAKGGRYFVGHARSPRNPNLGNKPDVSPNMYYLF